MALLGDISSPSSIASPRASMVMSPRASVVSPRDQQASGPSPRNSSYSGKDPQSAASPRSAGGKLREQPPSNSAMIGGLPPLVTPSGLPPIMASNGLPPLMGSPQSDVQYDSDLPPIANYNPRPNNGVASPSPPAPNNGDATVPLLVRTQSTAQSPHLASPMANAPSKSETNVLSPRQSSDVSKKSPRATADSTVSPRNSSVHRENSVVRGPEDETYQGPTFVVQRPLKK